MVGGITMRKADFGNFECDFIREWSFSNVVCAGDRDTQASTSSSSSMRCFSTNMDNSQMLMGDNHNSLSSSSIALATLFFNMSGAAAFQIQI